MHIECALPRGQLTAAKTHDGAWRNPYYMPETATRNLNTRLKIIVEISYVELSNCRQRIRTIGGTDVELTRYHGSS